MPSPLDYREHAIEFVRIAQTTVDEEDKACLFALATMFIKIAERLEKEERRSVWQGETTSSKTQ
jgi:hypothetical protein